MLTIDVVDVVAVVGFVVVDSDCCCQLLKRLAAVASVFLQQMAVAHSRRRNRLAVDHLQGVHPVNGNQCSPWDQQETSPRDVGMRRTDEHPDEHPGEEVLTNALKVLHHVANGELVYEVIKG